MYTSPNPICVASDSSEIQETCGEKNSSRMENHTKCISYWASHVNIRLPLQISRTRQRERPDHCFHCRVPWITEGNYTPRTTVCTSFRLRLKANYILIIIIILFKESFETSAMQNALLGSSIIQINIIQIVSSYQENSRYFKPVMK